MIAADAISASLAVLLAIQVGSNYSVRPGYLLMVPVIVLMAKVQGLYDRDELVIRKSTVDELPRLFNLATLVTLVVWMARHFTVIGAPSTWTLLKLWVALLVFTTLGRVAARATASRIAPRERCFFIGDAHTEQRLLSKFTNGKSTELVGAIEPPRDLTDLGLPALIRQYRVHRLIIAAPGGVADEDTIDLVRTAKAIGVRVTICPGVLDVVGNSLVLDDVWGMPLLGVPRFGLTRSSALLKRTFDLLCSSIVLLLALPLLALAAVLIKLDSPGPVLFRQRRVGRNGEPFEIFKLRTMRRDAEEVKPQLRDLNEAEGIFKIHEDPRVTRIGRLLRMTSLDELPQLVNVLKGQMSLVGPRPLVTDEDEMITGFDRRRLAITPGMTGPWQVLGSARVPLHEMIKLDYMYVANWSLWSDVKILLRTLGVVVSGRGI